METIDKHNGYTLIKTQYSYQIDEPQENMEYSAFGILRIDQKFNRNDSTTTYKVHVGTTAFSDGDTDFIKRYAKALVTAAETADYFTDVIAMYESGTYPPAEPKKPTRAIARRGFQAWDKYRNQITIPIYTPVTVTEWSGDYAEVELDGYTAVVRADELEPRN